MKLYDISFLIIFGIFIAGMFAGKNACSCSDIEEPQPPKIVAPTL